MSELTVQAFPNGRLVENCWLLGDPATREAVLVDPGEEPARALAALRHGDWRLRAIWLTHGHADHVLGVGQVKAATGAPILLHPDDRFLYDAAPEFAADPATPPAMPAPDVLLADGARLSVGGSAFVVRHLPGHSPGHVVYLGEGRAIVGDVLFQGSIGHDRGPGGDHDQLLEGIEEVLLPLPDATEVLPGHGRPTTIGRERRSNPFLADLHPRA